MIPQREKNNLRQDALERLEWPLLTKSLEDQASLSTTKARLSHIKPWQFTEYERSQWISITQEQRELMGLNLCLRIPEIDSNLFIQPLEHKGLFSPEGLFQVLLIYESAQEAAEIYKKTHDSTKERFQNAFALLANFIPDDSFAKVLKRSVDAEGSILDTASEELAAARHALNNAHRTAKSLLEDLLRNNTIRDALQDPIWMQREGRYVLPVRTDRKSQVSGLPMGVSGSGATVFVEPTALASAQAKIEEAKTEVQIEESRIIQRLSERAWGCAEIIHHNLETLSMYDESLARARFAQNLDGVAPQFTKSPETRFSFTSLKHPLYVLEKKACISNDMSLFKERHKKVAPQIWVLTGPNAGGKTVAMKSVGLSVLMAKCGLFVPASTALVYDYEDVFVEMGDRQNREEDLSTFSGHLLHVRSILENSTDKCLVLLDEGFVGTDPSVGVALARATLEHLCQKGSSAIITTHFSTLKHLANSDERFLNASMEFEPTQLKPTYKLLGGIPGQSYAIELGERLGFPDEILEKAKAYVGEEAQRLEKLLNEVQTRKNKLEKLYAKEKEKQASLEEEMQALKKERAETLKFRTDTMDEYRSELEKKLKAFEHRMEVRERQYEKHKEKEIGRYKEEAEKRMEKMRESLLKNLPADTEAPQELSTPQKISFEHLPQKRKADKDKAKSLSSFSDLSSLKLPTKRKAQSQDKREKDKLDKKAKGYKNLQSYDTKSILEDMKEALEKTDHRFDSIDDYYRDRVGHLIKGDDKVIQKANKIVKKAKDTQTESPQPVVHWKKGMPVKSSRFRQAGVVVKPADAKGMVECQFGMMKVKLSETSLMTLEKAAGSNPSPKAKISYKEAAQSMPRKKKAKQENPMDMSLEGVVQHSGNRVDLRGLTGDEALDKLDTFIDRCFYDGRGSAVVVHGLGTGKVRKEVREWLKTCDYDLRWRPGATGEGGDGVTLVVFK